MSAVPPNFRNTSALITIRESSCSTGIPAVPIGLPLITVGISVEIYLENLTILRSFQSSKVTSILPSRKFSPATFSLHIRNCMYFSSSMPFVCNCYSLFKHIFYSLSIPFCVCFVAVELQGVKKLTRQCSFDRIKL
jgi:hypothetical protein